MGQCPHPDTQSEAVGGSVLTLRVRGQGVVSLPSYSGGGAVSSL